MSLGPVARDGRFGRRLLVLYLACAVLPTLAVSLACFLIVRAELGRESERRLHAASKAVVLTLAERLALAARDLPGAPGDGAGDGLLHDRADVLHGAPLAHDDPQGAWKRLDRGLPLLLTHVGENGPVIEILRGTRSGRLDVAALAEQLSAPLPPGGGLLVLDRHGRIVLSTLADTGPVLAALPRHVGGRQGAFRWEGPDGPHHAYARTLFLEPQFGAGSWSVIVSEPRALAQGPLLRLAGIVPAVLGAALGLVWLYSRRLIGRSLGPLQRLHEATRRVASGDLTARVGLGSGSGDDELAQLGRAFDEMAQQLQRQFRVLGTSAEIDRVILAALDEERIVRTVLERVKDVLPCAVTAITLLPETAGAPLEVYRTHPGADPAIRTFARPGVADRETLCGEARHGAPSFLAPHMAGAGAVRTVPVRAGGETLALITVGLSPGLEWGAEDRLDLQRIADQVGIALTNARLIGRLERLHWETLSALARAIDAKSPWTAGHSQRVTEMALRIGRQLGLDAAALDTLHRAGLLHDLGKLGIPAAILDKPDRLLPEEWGVMRQHSEIGARILEPLTAFADTLPIVRHHHERWDGSGYPDRLQGQSIPEGARILAVADVFDALASERPYRGAWPVDRAVAEIRSGAGKQFDPRIVAAFLALVDGSGRGLDLTVPGFVPGLPAPAAAAARVSAEDR